MMKKRINRLLTPAVASQTVILNSFQELNPIETCDFYCKIKKLCVTLCLCGEKMHHEEHKGHEEKLKRYICE